MSDSELRELPERTLQSYAFRWTVLLLTVMLVGLAIYTASLGGFETAGQLASITVALATILLVSLTSQYAEQTKELVSESKQDRKQRKQTREREKQTELDSLRRALYEEINKVEYFDELAEEYSVGHSVLGVHTPTTIYESNAPQIGLLTEEEVDPVVEYYTRLERLPDLLEMQRKMDTTVDMGSVEKGVKISEGLVEQLVHKGSFGRVPPSWENRTETIQERIQSLAEARKNALSALEENMDD